MFQFLLNNKPFVTEKSASVKLSWLNPACQLNDWSGDAGLDISFPANDNNLMMLGYPNRFESYASLKNEEFEGFEIRYGGYFLLSGTFVVQNADKSTIKGWLRGSTGNIKKEHREKFIYDSVSFNQAKSFQNKADYDPDTDEYGCPEIHNQDFFDEKGEKITLTENIINPNFIPEDWNWDMTNLIEDAYVPLGYEMEDLSAAFFRTTGWLINKKKEDGTILAETSSCESSSEKITKELNVSVVSPMLFLNFVLHTIFKDAGFYLDENFLATNDDLKKLIIYHNFDITRITYETIETEWDEAQWGRAGEYLGLIATGKSVNSIVRAVTEDFLYKKLLPKIKLKEFILGTNNLLNVFPFFKKNKRVDIIDRESILTGESIDIDRYIIGDWQMGGKDNNTIKLAFSHDDNDVFFKERWKDIDDYRDNEKEPVETWDDLKLITIPEMGETRYIKSQNRYAQYKLWIKETEDVTTGKTIQEKYIGWEEVAQGFQNGYINYGQEEEETIDTCFSTLAGEDKPTAGQKGNIQSEMFNFENFSPRLLFYLGNNTAKYETDTISLDWEKETTGLMETRWKWWSRFWATKQEVTREAYLPLNVLDYMLRNIYKKFRTREGEFIIESLETTFSVNGFSSTTIKGYKINYAPKTYTLSDTWQLSDFIFPDEFIDTSGLEQFHPLLF